jgi:2-methylisocitrate lyase-like PEP mutase family enzyme
MNRSLKEKRARFRELQNGCFMLPNPWDVGSARMLESLGFEALASTSAGYGWSTGRPDYSVTRDDLLQHLAALSSGVNVPVNADYEGGFARDPEGVAQNVSLAIATGVSGLSIEDRVVGEAGLYDLATSVERLKAARSAIDQSGEDVILVARTEGLLLDATALKPAIEKLVAFADAGADCLYAPGVSDPGDIAAIVKAVAQKPVNVLMMWPGLSLAELADLGVRRVSIGGALARVVWAPPSPRRANSKKGASTCWGPASPAPVSTRCSTPPSTSKAPRATRRGLGHVFGEFMKFAGQGYRP